MNLFITGTDTDAGKTTVSAWICSKIRTKYLKLIQTGSDSDSTTVKNFAPNTEILPEIYKLHAPLSAYDAAKLENITIDVEKFRINYDKTVIEGAGGIFVPIASNFLMIDAIERTNSCALVVARAKLGMINHTLLTISALKNRNISIAGIVVCGDLEKNIVDTIEHFSGEKIIANLHHSNGDLKNLFESTPLPQNILGVLK